MSKPKARVRLWSEQSPEPVPSHGGPAVGTYWKLSIEDVVLGSEYDRRYWCADRQKYTKIEYAPRNLVDLFNKLCEVFDAPDEAPAVENYREPGEFGEGATVRRAEPTSAQWRCYGPCVVFEGGGFDVGGCPDPEQLASFIVEAVNNYDADAQKMREALRKIAAYDDAAANAYLRATGSYRCFDEPGAVEMARGVLEGRNNG